MELERCPKIDQLIHFVSKNGIQELTLYLFNGGPYKLPSSLFSCGGITCLDLFSCVFKPPPGFKGFGKLLCLELHYVVIAGDALSNLISASPLLERLTIRRASFNYLEIVALNLNSSFTSLVSRDRETFGSVMHSGTFPVVERLKLDYYHLKAMAAGGWSDISLNQLREVEIHGVAGTRLELDFIKVLLAKSPILERLLIKLESEEVSEESRILKELIGFKRLSPEAVIMFKNRDEVLRLGDGFE
ncbi:hypothetical protein C3L33_13618, partial [Rhododendron williamsianum]